MYHRAIFLAFLAVLALALAGCTVAENTDPNDGDPGPGLSSDYWATTAIVDWGQIDLTDPAEVAKYAQADIVVFETAYLWNGNMNAGGLDAIRELNPDVRIVGYVNAHGSWLRWGEVSRADATVPYYGWDWFQATKKFWSYTTTGDTMCSWPGKVLLDVLDPACRQAMVDVLAAHWTAHDNVLDGIFWDHFNNFLWVPDQIEGVEGEMDLDGDGIPHRQDEDEMAAYRAAAEDLILRARRALGGDVIQIANGQRGPAQPEFAALLDGMFYENFPEYNYTGDKLQASLDRTVPNNLFDARTWCRTQNGGPWLILSNWNRFTAPDEDGNLVSWRRSDLNRAIGLISGCLSVYYPGAQYRYDWPEVDLDLGLPLGEAVQEGQKYTREFENGHVVLNFAESTSAVPFGFAIVEQDETRQLLQIGEELLF